MSGQTRKKRAYLVHTLTPGTDGETAVIRWLSYGEATKLAWTITGVVCPVVVLWQNGNEQPTVTLGERL